MQTNTERSMEKSFKTLCKSAAKKISRRKHATIVPFGFDSVGELAEKLATARQASKYMMGKGVVYKLVNNMM